MLRYGLTLRFRSPANARDVSANCIHFLFRPCCSQWVSTESSGRRARSTLAHRELAPSPLLPSLSWLELMQDSQR